ncbi:GNAT family N-acetyltransferase [Rothia sp. AR01]|uniref:GNAT family N-acetyltransferase n=1 Tax=Rothia santali TaxID=2949643 RepID=A0A9X2HCS9_9MICC|nr:GNAT family N-acetyltransferase [Rothia santali]MCP3425352.1 GNAT family N-acetyltransferase [Rothia santali]
MSTPFAPIRTRRLVLRPHVASDAGWMQRVYSRDDVARYLLDEPWTPETARAKNDERIRRTGLDGPEGALNLMLEHEGRPVGTVSLWLTDRESRLAEAGWVLDPDHGGRGLATEAVAAVVELAFERYGVHRLVARMDARNAASARLARRVGMWQEAHLRQDWWNRGEWTDTLVFGLLEGDRG